MMSVFSYEGDAVFEGKWTTITSARSFDGLLLSPPGDATHWSRYTSAGTTAIVVGQLVYGATSTTDTTGDTASGSPVVTGLASTADFPVGGWVTFSAGFTENTPYRIMARTDTTITVNKPASSAQSNITTTLVATGRVKGVVLEQGTVAGGDGEGTLLIGEKTGTFAAGAIAIPGGTDEATIPGDFVPLLAHGRCKAALVAVETAAVCFSLSGTVPTVTAGTNMVATLNANGSMMVTGWDNVRNFAAINAVASSGAILKYSLLF
jgi:hypothetical protein